MRTKTARGRKMMRQSRKTLNKERNAFAFRFFNYKSVTFVICYLTNVLLEMAFFRYSAGMPKA